eukprot:GFYU01041482.1.p1 GENE.GFYU01041482.1~~GFYU01041482.1.p1  ORF type:complete len:174 (+),score=49.03 GFYU01041482.1:12-533(+)
MKKCFGRCTRKGDVPERTSQSASARQAKYAQESGPRESETTLPAQYEYHVFLSHDWGEDGENHERVSEMNRYLQDKGLVTWFDGDRMEGTIKRQMAKGIAKSMLVVVFVTERYETKVSGKGPNGKRDNCFKEFNHAEKKCGSEYMIPVVMEPRMTDTPKWSGMLGIVLRVSCT